MLSDKEILKLYEDFEEEINPTIKHIQNKDICDFENCGGKYINWLHMRVCIMCGSADEYSYVNEKLEHNEIDKKKYFYKRRVYFEDKLKYITGIKRTNTKKITEIIEQLKSESITDIKDLYKLLKKKKLSKYYKDIYNIYFDLKNIRLINITESQIKVLSKEFVKLDYNFKINSKNNMLSYQSIIKYLLDKYLIKGTEHILTPANYPKIILEITRINNA